MLWMGLVCVPEGSVRWDIQVIIAEEVGIMRNDMDDQRRVVRLIASEVWWIEGEG